MNARTGRRVGYVCLMTSWAGVLLSLSAAVASTPTTPAWCTWPDDAGQAALHSAVTAELDEIHRHSPGAALDPFTVQLGLMARCDQGALT